MPDSCLAPWLPDLQPPSRSQQVFCGQMTNVCFRAKARVIRVGFQKENVVLPSTYYVLNAGTSPRMIAGPPRLNCQGLPTFWRMEPRTLGPLPQHPWQLGACHHLSSQPWRTLSSLQHSCPCVWCSAPSAGGRCPSWWLVLL